MRYLFSVGVVLIVSVYTWADEPKFTPKKDSAPESQLFPEIQREARRINDEILTARTKLDQQVVPTKESVEDSFPLDDVQAFGRLVRSTVGARLTSSEFPKIDRQLEYFARELSAKQRTQLKMPEFYLEQVSLSELHYLFTGDVAENTGTLDLGSDGKIKLQAPVGTLEKTRREALTELRDAIAPYKLNDAAYDAFKTRGLLLKMADDWDAYFESSRPQTLWDIALTTVVNQRHFRQDKLVGPPPLQCFLLHPNVVVETVNAAPDGKQMSGAVAIEWIGVNWWSIKVPFGISLSSLYSDRPGVNDVGHGVTLYFANRYCIGWARHGRHDGFFASIDALKLVDSKKGKLDSYRSQVGKLLAR